MLGHPEDPGVIFLTMMELYRRIDSLKASKTCRVSVSYSEVSPVILTSSHITWCIACRYTMRLYEIFWCPQGLSTSGRMDIKVRESGTSELPMIC